jgi:hypothetical protein
MTLFVVILVLAGLAAVGLTVFSSSLIDLNITRNYKNTVQAFCQAEAGAEYVLKAVQEDVDAGSVSLGDPVVTVNYTPPSDLDFEPVTQLQRLADGRSYLFQVTGRAVNSRATVEVVFQTSRLFDLDMFAEDLITLSGNAWANGNLRCNGNIKVTGPVTGDAIPGPGCVVDKPEVVTGSTTPASEPLVLDPVDPLALAAAQADNDNDTIDPGYLDGDKLTVSGDTLVLGSGIYYFSEVTFSGGAILEVGGQVVIYCTGKFTVSGGGIANPDMDPDDLVVWCTTTDKVTISGTSASYGHFYAPNAKEVVVSGGGTYNGALISGGKVTFSGGSNYGGYGGAGGGGGALGVLSWKHLRQ